ncbi:MAG: glycogen synthase [Actinomycetota bacterium]|nr:glycogen synthase [Actinomycetota bacterium]
MRAALLTREYPPEVYGGAGVHVEYLARELARLVDVEVHCFGADRASATAYRVDPALAGANAALQTMSVDLAMAAGVAGADLVHSHTWYANLAGHLAKLLHDVPHVMTTHSLEPLRPWKAEQLGGGYALAGFCERTALEGADAVIAVSAAMRDDVLASYPDLDPARLHVIGNGIDTGEYAPDDAVDVLLGHGIDPDRPYVIFVGRNTRQKGVAHLLAAARFLDPEAQLVLCAGAPDTPRIGAEVAAAVDELRASRRGVVWIEAMLAKPDVIQLLSHATVFVCPSVYEPLGIVNLEAMACETAVVASAVGGIPEVVDDGETGLLVPYDAADPVAFELALATALNAVLADPERAGAMGRAGRRRAVESFSWTTVAERTVALYRSL